MIKAQRHNEILRLLEQRETVLVSDLADMLACSKMTIRRDVEELEARSLVKRVHGGVMLYHADDLQPSFNRRVIQNPEEKCRIAKEAVSFIEPGSSVFFDAGTTPLYLAKSLPANLAFTAITNSLQTAMELSNLPNVTVIMLAGEVHHSSYSVVNKLAVKTAAKFRTDLAVISTKSISVPNGLYETNLSLIEIKQALVSGAKKVILLADYSKFNEDAMCLSIKMEDIDVVITDTKTSQAHIQQLKDMGIDVKVV